MPRNLLQQCFVYALHGVGFALLFLLHFNFPDVLFIRSSPDRRFETDSQAVFSPLCTALVYVFVRSGGICLRFAPTTRRLLGRRHSVSQLVVVGILSFRRLYNYDLKIRNFYSSIDDKTVKSTIMISLLYFLAAICSVILSVLGREWFIGSFVLCVPSLVYTILTMAFGYVGSKYTFKVEQFDLDANGSGNGTDEQEDYLFSSIEIVMTEKQLFLQQGFNINELATAVGSN